MQSTNKFRVVRSAAAASVNDQQLVTRTPLSNLNHPRRFDVIRAPALRLRGHLRRLTKRALAVIRATRLHGLRDAAERRHLADEYAPELLPDEAVHGEVDRRVKGQQGVAGNIGVAKGRNVEPNYSAGRELVCRDRDADGEIRQLANDEDRYHGNQHQGQVLPAAVPSSAASFRLLDEQAAPTSAHHPQSSYQFKVQHDERDQRSHGTEDEVAGRFIDEKVVSIAT